MKKYLHVYEAIRAGCRTSIDVAAYLDISVKDASGLLGKAADHDLIYRHGMCKYPGRPRKNWIWKVTIKNEKEIKT